MSMEHAANEHFAHQKGAAHTGGKEPSSPLSPNTVLPHAGRGDSSPKAMMGGVDPLDRSDDVAQEQQARHRSSAPYHYAKQGVFPVS